MRRFLFCLTVLVPFGCSEYATTVDGAGGTTSTAPSSSATGGSSVGNSGTPAEGGASSSTTTAESGSGGTNATGGTGTAVSSVGGTTAGGDSSVAGSTAGGGSAPTAGTAGTADVGCGLPSAGNRGVAKPSGTVGGFKVIDWAGFKGAVSFVFDDGTVSQLENYTALKNLGVKYTFFLIGSSATTNKIKWQKAVADGNELGNHTQYHKQNDPAGSDTGAGQQTIESNYNVKVYTMAAPYGNDYTAIAPNYHFLNRGTGNGLMKPNNDSNAFDTFCHIPALGAKTAAMDAEVKLARDGNGWKVILVHGFTGDSNAYNAVDFDQFTQAVQNAKAPGDLWIDTFASVGAYWRGQAAVSKVQAETSGSDQTWTWNLPAHFPPGKCLRATVTGGTLKQNGNPLPWDDHGYYEIALDAGSITLSP